MEKNVSFLANPETTVSGSRKGAADKGCRIVVPDRERLKNWRFRTPHFGANVVFELHLLVETVNIV
jgi:hypothetical protein